MSNLPNRPFMFNYNAKEYDAVNRTFPKTQGQLYNYDIKLNGDPFAFDAEEGYVDFSNTYSLWDGKAYNTPSENPFNRDSSNNSFTFVYKTSGFTSGDNNLFGNRNADYNYMIRGNMFHTGDSGYLFFSPSEHPQIVFIRVYSDGSCERKEIDANGNVIQYTSASTITWGGSSNGFAFFAGYYGGNEYFVDKFYWMYCSLETLTDNEILQVVGFNENHSPFRIDKNYIGFPYSGGTDTIEVSSDNPWTASTQDNWFSLSSTGASSSSTITVTTGQNTGRVRTGTISFTNGEDTLTCIITQGMNNTFPIKKIYRNGRRIN